MPDSDAHQFGHAGEHDAALIAVALCPRGCEQRREALQGHPGGGVVETQGYRQGQVLVAHPDQEPPRQQGSQGSVEPVGVCRLTGGLHQAAQQVRPAGDAVAGLEEPAHRSGQGDEGVGGIGPQVD